MRWPENCEAMREKQTILLRASKAHLVDLIGTMNNLRNTKRKTAIVGVLTANITFLELLSSWDEVPDLHKWCMRQHDHLVTLERLLEQYHVEHQAEDLQKIRVAWYRASQAWKQFELDQVQTPAEIDQLQTLF